MKTNYNDFIGIYDDVYPEGYCEHLINVFNELRNTGVGQNRMESEGALEKHKNDYQISLNVYKDSIQYFNQESPVNIFFQGLQKCYNDYSNKFSSIQNGETRAYIMKMQCTNPGGGYHIWHGEQGSGASSNRVLVYMLYLNTLEYNEAGETEFLYQQLRFKPQKNQMLLWPASYTHAHRGNTVFGKNSKYVITGWFYYDC